MRIRLPDQMISAKPVIITQDENSIVLSTVDYYLWLRRVKEDKFIPHRDDAKPGVVYIRPFSRTSEEDYQGIYVTEEEWAVFRNDAIRGKYDFYPDATPKL